MRNGGAVERRAGQAGFTILGLLVVVAVINIGLAVATTSWVTIDRRAREAELLWRGRQYQRALRCHQRETGALPNELEELLESNCIRRLWRDPMSDDGEWQLLRLGDLESLPREQGGSGDGEPTLFDRIRGSGAEDEQGRGGEADGGRLSIGVRGDQVRIELPAGQIELNERLLVQTRLASVLNRAVQRDGPRTVALARALGGLQRDPSESGNLQAMLQAARSAFDDIRGDDGRSLGPDAIVGVASSSREEGLRMFDGERAYDLWRFTVQVQGIR